MSPSTTFGIRIPEDLMREIDAYQDTAKLASRSEAVLRLVRQGLPKHRETTPAAPASQDRASGAAANRWGHATSRKIANILGARETSTTSNDFELDGLPVTIRCARIGNNQVGLYDTVRDRVAFIIAAFQQREGHFELYRLTPELWAKNCNDVAASNPNHGRLTMSNRSRFRQFGESLGEIQIEEQTDD